MRGVSTAAAGACSLIVKLGLITATNYPAVIRVLSERYPGRYPPLPTLYSTKEPSRHHPNHYGTLEPYPRESKRKRKGYRRRERDGKRENDSTLNTKVRCCRLLLQTK